MEQTVILPVTAAYTAPNRFWEVCLVSTKFTELHCKEVICISAGRRLGFIADACVEIPTGNIASIIVPGPCRLFGLLGRQEDFRIPWGCIRRIGPDIVLVDIKPEDCRVPRGRQGWLFG